MMASAEQVWTVSSIIEWTQQYFKNHKITSPRLDAELLLAFVFQCSRMDLYLAYDKPLMDKERRQYRELVKKRVQGIPVAYLLKEKGFWSLTLFVEEGALIPRPDTEILVEQVCSAIEEWQVTHKEKTCFVLEIGTGTAAIPLALCSSLQNLQIVSVDISEAALQVAVENIKNHQYLLTLRANALQLVRGDRFEMLHPATKFDFIVSNPPYIPTLQIPKLQKEIALYEPRQALDGGEDGLDFFRYFFRHGADHLKARGEMFLEIGSDQVNRLEAILPLHLELIQIAEDLQSHPRVWHGRRCV